MLMVIERYFNLWAVFGRVDEIESINADNWDADSVICDIIKTFKKGKTFFQFFFSFLSLFLFVFVISIKYVNSVLQPIWEWNKNYEHSFMW